MFGIGLLLIALSPAVRAPELRPPTAVRIGVQTAARPRRAGHRSTPAVFPRRGARPAASVTSDRSAVSGLVAALINPRPALGTVRPTPVRGPLARGTDARAQRGPPLPVR